MKWLGYVSTIAATAEMLLLAGMLFIVSKWTSSDVMDALPLVVAFLALERSHRPLPPVPVHSLGQG
jgi:hypothetical protein